MVPRFAWFACAKRGRACVPMRMEKGGEVRATKIVVMDHAPLTFSLLDEIAKAENYNGLITFTNVTEAKKLLKLQIANFVGESLSKVFSPMRSEIKDVLAEIITLRQQLASQNKANPVFINAIRFIIDDNRAKGLKYLIEHSIGPLDQAFSIIVESKTFGTMHLTKNRHSIKQA